MRVLQEIQALAETRLGPTAVVELNEQDSYVIVHTVSDYPLFTVFIERDTHFFQWMCDLTDGHQDITTPVVFMSDYNLYRYVDHALTALAAFGSMQVEILSYDWLETVQKQTVTVSTVSHYAAAYTPESEKRTS